MIPVVVEAPTVLNSWTLTGRHARRLALRDLHQLPWLASRVQHFGSLGCPEGT